MNKIAIFLLFVLAFGLCGCVIVRPRASTVLTIHPKGDKAGSATMGFRDATWAEVEDRLTII
ncbi:MAG: hypothetical protein ACYSWU_29320, partial [Planctomycetota bacterium]